EAVRRFCIGDAFFQSISHTGLGTYLTLQLGAVELEAGDRRALDRLWWMLSAATPTYTWPEAIHPQLGGGCMGDGHHGWAAADFLSLVRNLLVREVSGGLALVSLLPEEWRGQSLSVHDAPTHQGRLSFAVRWHGPPPARYWRAMGFADVPDDEPVFTDTDIEALVTLRRLIEEGVIDAGVALQLTRVYGQSLARMADAQVAAIRERIEAPLRQADANEPEI